MDEPKPGETPEIADASLLFGDGPTPPRSASGPARTPAAEGAGYDLESAGPTDARPRATVPPGAETRERPRGDRPRPASPKEEAPGADVSIVWSRAAEWGVDLLRLGIGGLVYVIVVYSTFSVDALGLWLLTAFLGLLALVALAYPIFITLERPVRVTPEQAVKDYYDALGHLLPHYRRMWLLLSDTGKAEFAGYADFRAHWRARLSGWRTKAGLSGPGNRIRLLVPTFRAEGKSAGVSRIEAEYAVNVVGPDESAPIRSYAVKAELVKGTDRMWYLRSGKPPS